MNKKPFASTRLVFNPAILDNEHFFLQLKQYLEQGVAKKPAGYGDRAKVSTQTCQVCLQDPRTYNQVPNSWLFLTGGNPLSF